MMLHTTALQSQVVKGRQLFRHSSHAHLKTLRTHGFPIQTWETLSYLKVKIKIPLSQIASFCSFCMQI